MNRSRAVSTGHLLILPLFIYPICYPRQSSVDAPRICARAIGPACCFSPPTNAKRQASSLEHKLGQPEGGGGPGVKSSRDDGQHLFHGQGVSLLLICDHRNLEQGAAGIAMHAGTSPRTCVKPLRGGINDTDITALQLWTRMSPSWATTSRMTKGERASQPFPTELKREHSADLRSLSSSRFLKTILARHANGPLVLKIFIKPDPNMSLRLAQRRLKSTSLQYIRYLMRAWGLINRRAETHGQHAECQHVPDVCGDGQGGISDTAVDRAQSI